MTDEREIVKLENDHGELREYETVASRLARFRAEHPDWSIIPEIIEATEQHVRMRVVIGKTTEDGTYVAISAGHAEEYRSSSRLNRTSALENCETSALGRALAFAGYASANSIATADEVRGAKDKAADQDKREAGILALLQTAADQGTKEMRRVWEDELSEEDRIIVGNRAAKLKKRAREVDAGRAGK